MSESAGAGDNPYAPPQAERQIVPACLFWNPGAELQAQRVPRATRLLRLPLAGLLEDLYVRRIQFWGEFVGVVEWKASLYESVAVNDIVYCSHRNLGVHLIPRFEVPVQAGRPSTLVVEVRSHNWCGYWPVIDAFRIRLDGRTLYFEGEWLDEAGTDKAPG